MNLFTVGSSSRLPFYASAVDEGAAFEWSVAAIPHNTPKPVQNICGESVSMPKHTLESELATWLFVKYYASPKVQARPSTAPLSRPFPVTSLRVILSARPQLASPLATT